jgi:AraC-like DNA-binding protein
MDIRKLAGNLKKLGIRHSHLGKVRVFHVMFSLIALIWVLEALFHLPIFRITITFLCGFVFLIGYISFYNPNFLLPPPFLRIKAAVTASGTQVRDAQLEKIRHGFHAEQLFLRHKLSLKEAAESLGMPPRQLSEVINRYYEMDFSNFVNSHRVEEVIRKVEAGELKHKTLLGVALESGFNSKSSFNQAFRDLKGKSPSQYFAGN